MNYVDFFLLLFASFTDVVLAFAVFHLVSFGFAWINKYRVEELGKKAFPGALILFLSLFSALSFVF